VTTMVPLTFLHGFLGAGTLRNPDPFARPSPRREEQPHDDPTCVSGCGAVPHTCAGVTDG
jgi:hypothetical protein